VSISSRPCSVSFPRARRSGDVARAAVRGTGTWSAGAAVSAFAGAGVRRPRPGWVRSPGRDVIAVWSGPGRLAPWVHGQPVGERIRARADPDRAGRSRRGSRRLGYRNRFPADDRAALRRPDDDRRRLARVGPVYCKNQVDRAGRLVRDLMVIDGHEREPVPVAGERSSKHSRSSSAGAHCTRGRCDE
jgi:hypothetical protein